MWCCSACGLSRNAWRKFWFPPRHILLDIRDEEVAYEEDYKDDKDQEHKDKDADEFEDYKW